MKYIVIYWSKVTNNNIGYIISNKPKQILHDYENGRDCKELRKYRIFEVSNDFKVVKGSTLQQSIWDSKYNNLTFLKNILL